MTQRFLVIEDRERTVYSSRWVADSLEWGETGSTGGKSIPRAGRNSCGNRDFTGSFASYLGGHYTSGSENHARVPASSIESG